MDFNFLAAANGIANKYLNQLPDHNATSGIHNLDENAMSRFGEDVDKAYDSLQATKVLNASMRQSYDASHKDDLFYHAERLGFSIDNRIIDMLHLELTSRMDAQVNSAMNNAIKNL